MAANLADLLKGSALERWQAEYKRRCKLGVPEELAAYTAAASELYASLGIIEATDDTNHDISTVGNAYFSIGEQLSLSWYLEEINQLPATNYWEAMARESFRDDLDGQQRSLTVGILHNHQSEDSIETSIQRWEADQLHLVERWQRMLEELKSTEYLTFPMIAVGLRELLDLAQASQQSRKES